MLDLDLETPRRHLYDDALVARLGGDWPVAAPPATARPLDPDAFATLAARLVRGKQLEWWWVHLYLLPEINGRDPMGARERMAWFGALFDPAYSGPTREEDGLDGLLARGLEWAQARWSTDGLMETLSGAGCRANQQQRLEPYVDWVVYGALLRRTLPWADTLEALEGELDPGALCALAWGLGPCPREERPRGEALTARVAAAIPPAQWFAKNVSRLVQRAPEQSVVDQIIDDFLARETLRDGDIYLTPAMLCTNSRERFEQVAMTRRIQLRHSGVRRVFARWGFPGVEVLLEVGLNRKRKKDRISGRLLEAFEELHAPEVVANLFPYDDRGNARGDVVDRYLSGAPAEHVAHGLIACCNRAGKKRTWAVERMRALLARDGGRAALEAALTQWKKRTADFVRAEVLDHDEVARAPLGELPEWARALAARGEGEEMPVWFGAGELTPLRTVDGRALPDACARGLLLEDLDGAFDDDDAARFTPESLTGLALELMQRWCNARYLMPSGVRSNAKMSPISWLGRFPSPATVAALDSYIRTKKQPNRNRKDPDVYIDHAARTLASIESVEGLAATLRLEENKRSTAQWIGERGVKAAMKRLGVTRAELVHLAVPTFGLNARGERDFDYGSRTIRLRLEGGAVTYEDLSTGKTSTRAPKGKREDDVDKVEAARAQIALVHKPLTAELARHASLFEADMVTRQGWKGAHWRERIVGHGLLGPLAAQLVWRVSAKGQPHRFVRPTLDGSLVDADMDDAPPVREDEHVLLAHPIELGEEWTPWSEHLGSFEITQPFEQLGRATYDWDAAAQALLDALEHHGALLEPKLLRKLLHERAGKLIDSSSYGRLTTSYALADGALSLSLRHTDVRSKSSPLQFTGATREEQAIAREGDGPNTWAELPEILRSEALRALNLAKIEG